MFALNFKFVPKHALIQSNRFIRPPAFEPAAKLAQVLVGCHLIKPLRHEVCRILFAVHLLILDVSSQLLLLDPEELGVQVPEFAASLSVKDAHCGTGIDPHIALDVQSHVVCHRNHSLKFV